MAKILLIGDICAERQYIVDTIPAPDELGIVAHTNHLTSSKIINAGRVLAKGTQVSMFGVIGQDEEGKQALKDLQKYNIDTSLIYAVSKPTDEVLVITNKEGRTAIILYPSTFNDFDGSKLTNLSDYDYIYTATSLPLPQLYTLLEKAANDNVKVFLDVPNQHDALDLTRLQTVEFLVPNRHEAELMLQTTIESVEDGLKAVEKLKTYIQGTAVITLDQDGCVVFGKGWTKPQHFPIQQVAIVDVTGAGDIFRGALLREYIQTHEITASVQKALLLSSESVKIQGVDNSIIAVNNLS